jgi:hypothetical protein
MVPVPVPVPSFEKVTVPVPVPVPAPYLPQTIKSKFFKKKFGIFFDFLLSKMFHKEKFINFNKFMVKCE